MLKRAAIISFIPAHLSWNRANPKVVGEEMYYLLLDEIQMLDCFEAVLNGYLCKDNMDVFVIVCCMAVFLWLFFMREQTIRYLMIKKRTVALINVQFSFYAL